MTNAKHSLSFLLGLIVVFALMAIQLVHAAGEGVIYVTDTGNHRIQKFTPEGKFLVAFGSQGIGQGQFERPTDVALDDEGNIYVVDFGNNRIQKFAPLQ